MRLTKNDKSVLKVLLDNAKTTDSAIAAKLRVSSQAVGKIRKKLESSVISKYTVELQSSKLGMETYAIALAKMTRQGLENGQLQVEENLLNNPHVLSVYRIPQGNVTHAFICGFPSLTDMDRFFHSRQAQAELHEFLEISDLFTFSHHSVLKNSPNQLLHRLIDSFGKDSHNERFPEIKKFKQRL